MLKFLSLLAYSKDKSYTGLPIIQRDKTKNTKLKTNKQIKQTNQKENIVREDNATVKFYKPGLA